jgi:hypothetical protein
MSDDMSVGVRARLDQLRAGPSFDFSQMDTVNIRNFLRKWDTLDGVIAFDRHSDRWQALKWLERGDWAKVISVIVANDEQARMLCAGLHLRSRGGLGWVRRARWLAGMRALGAGQPLPRNPPSMPH